MTTDITARAIIARLGNVLYWAGCGCAIISLAFGVFVYTQAIHEHDKVFWLLTGGMAAIVFWLAGRACRYVLAGR